MHAILVATDLSHRSDRAMARAFLIAAETGARLIALAVVDEDLPEPLAETVMEKTRERLSALCETLRQNNDVAHEEMVVFGDPIRDINRVADEVGADLIVVGRHRLRPFMDLFVSTTVEKIVRVASVPVLLTCGLADRPYERAVSAVDLSPASAAALRIARLVAPKAKIHAFHAYSVPFRGFIGGDHPSEGGRGLFRAAAQAELEEWKARTHLPEDLGDVDLVEAAVGEALRAAIAREKPDFLALGAHGRAALSPTRLGSFTEELLRDPPCDLLIARR
ncbi:universal stress protein [Pikeienuella sp. HZG-20]|uniref:universal stress protein n=1 Tax=Paludibacillus litoralis TaxID=3133267 RepID=UPI0030EC6EA9